jgi:putative salt-induced outer membrane protein YdiY
MLLFLASFQALAEEPTFDTVKPVEAAVAPVTRLTANIGGNLTTGNSEAVSVNGGVEGSHHWGRNELSLAGGITLGFGAIDENADGFLAEAERCLGVEGKECASTAERVALDLRYDRFLSDKDSLYVLVGAFHDPFAGFELRSHAQLGYARVLVATAATGLSVELGADVANEDYVEGVTPASAKLIAAQASMKLTHNFNESVSFSDTLTAYEPVLTQPEGSEFSPYFTDLRIANTATLSAKLSDRFSVSVSDTLAWRNEPVSAPEGVSEKRANVDNTLMVALVASIL